MGGLLLHGLLLLGVVEGALGFGCVCDLFVAVKQPHNYRFKARQLLMEVLIVAQLLREQIHLTRQESRRINQLLDVVHLISLVQVRGTYVLHALVEQVVAPLRL